MLHLLRTAQRGLIGLLLLVLSACNSEGPLGPEDADDDLAEPALLRETARVSNLATEPLSDMEKASLLLVREEEKVARDVYQLMYLKWSKPIFAHIALSEQRHMDAVGKLITKYGLPDPVAATNDKPGVFLDPDLQVLYDELVVQGSASLVEALNAGVRFETEDIEVLENALVNEVDNKDITIVYSHLLRGATQHLIAFNRHLK